MLRQILPNQSSQQIKTRAAPNHSFQQTSQAKLLSQEADKRAALQLTLLKLVLTMYRPRQCQINPIKLPRLSFKIQQILQPVPCPERQRCNKIIPGNPNSMVLKYRQASDGPALEECILAIDELNTTASSVAAFWNFTCLKLMLYLCSSPIFSQLLSRPTS